MIYFICYFIVISRFISIKPEINKFSKKNVILYIFLLALDEDFFLSTKEFKNIQKLKKCRSYSEFTCDL